MAVGLSILLWGPVPAVEPPGLVPGPVLSGAWFDPAVPGQGLLLEVTDGQVFGGWFTFEAGVGKLGANGQRWLTLQGPVQGPAQGEAVELGVFVTAGGLFDEPVAVDTVPAGSASLRFFDCNHGRLDFSLDAGPQGGVSIQRLLPVDEADCAHLVEPSPPPEQVDWHARVALVGATVLPMDGGPALPSTTVVVEAGIIQAIGPMAELDLDEDTVVIDLRGRFLIPGITDAHTHLATNAREFAGSGVPLTEIDVIARNQLILYLANGVTTLINNGDFDEPLPAYARQVRSGELVGPTIYSARYARGNVSGCSDGNPVSVTVSDAASAREYLQQARSQGYDMIKIYNCTPADAVAVFLAEAPAMGLAVIGHTPQTVPVDELFDGGLAMVAHAESFVWTFFGFRHLPAGIPAARDLTLRNDTWVTGTLYIQELIAQIYGGNTAGIEAYWNRPQNRYMHPTTVNLNRRSIEAPWRWNPPGSSPGGWDERRDFVYQIAGDFEANGVRLLLGTDSPTVLGVPGFSALEELRVMVEIGIPVERALRIATANGGAFINEHLTGSEPFGAVEVGHRADLVALTRDPRIRLPARHHILGVMARGWWRSSAYFDQALADIAMSYGNAP